MPTQVKSASPSCVSSLQDGLDNKRPSLSSKWETFAANTTLHGLRNVVEDNRSKIRRTIWIIFLCGSTGYYFYFVFLCISKFNELPVQVIISQESTLLSGMDFPAVTICNLNQVMKSKLDMADDDKRFTEMGLNITGCHETRAIRGNLTCGRALRCVFSEQDEETGCDGTTRGKLSKAFNQTSFNMEEFYTNYGHDLEGLTSQFRYCVFEKRKNCSAKDFVPSITKDGICYTFNTGQNNAKLFRSKFEGPELGLNILLDVQTDEATFDLFGDLSSGLKVIIHDRKTLVNRFGGFNVMPGTQAMVGVKLINHTRLPPPYKTKCQQSRIPDIASYSEVACSFMCASNMTIKYCGCRRPGFPGPKTVRVCFPVRDKSCLVSDKIIWGVCNCSSACSELEYESQVSYSRFPDDAVIKILQNYKKIKESPSYMKKNFVFLQVGFQRLAYEKREVVRSYGAESLFGEIGGNMGLLLGCSVLTICEFFEFFLEALMSRIKRRNSTDVD